MIFQDKIKETKEQALHLKQEYGELSALITRKKAEIANMADGLKKYESNKMLYAQMEAVLKQRVAELRELCLRIEGLKQDYKQAKSELNRLFSRIKVRALQNKKQIIEPVAVSEPVKIATSPAVGKALDQVLAQSKEAINAVKPAKIIKEVQVKNTSPKKVKTSSDLYDVAASEAAAQDAFLRQQKTRNYGAI